MSLLRNGGRLTVALGQRQLTMSVRNMLATDPVQQLFVDKIRDYAKKSAGGKLVDATAEVQKSFEDRLSAVVRFLRVQFVGNAVTSSLQARTYGITDLNEAYKFPVVKFEQPKYESHTAPRVNAEVMQATKNATSDEGKTAKSGVPYIAI